MTTISRAAGGRTPEIQLHAYISHLQFYSASSWTMCKSLQSLVHLQADSLNILHCQVPSHWAGPEVGMSSPYSIIPALLGAGCCKQWVMYCCTEFYLRVNYQFISEWAGFTYGFLFSFKPSKISAWNRNEGADYSFLYFSRMVLTTSDS